MRKLTEQEKIEYERLVKGATQITMELVREKTGKTLCSKCLKEVSYREETQKIRYGFNGEDTILIDGIARYCNACGSQVDTEETILLNEQIALNNKGNEIRSTNMCLHNKEAPRGEIRDLQNTAIQTTNSSVLENFEYDIAENGQISLVFNNV